MSGKFWRGMTFVSVTLFCAGGLNGCGGGDDGDLHVGKLLNSLGRRTEARRIVPVIIGQKYSHHIRVIGPGLQKFGP